MANPLAKALFLLILLHASAATFSWATFSPPTQTVVDEDFSTSVSTHEVSDLFFLDSAQGWVALTDHNQGLSYVLRTRNGGNSWQKFSCPFGVRKVLFISSEQGWALRWVADPTLHKTTIHLLGTMDGGQHWHEAAQKPIVKSIEETHQYVTAMAFMDKLNGWIVGADPNQTGLILQTHDGGKTFDSTTFANTIFRGVTAGPKTGVLVFGDGSVLRSVDKGKHWEPAVSMKELGFNPATCFSMESAKFMHDGQGWLAGNAPGGTILATRDFGQSWRTQSKDNDVTLFYDLSVVDAKRLCAVGGGTLLFCSADGGLTWSSTDVLPKAVDGQSIVFENLVLLPSGRGWVVRSGGYLYQTADSGRTWKEVDATDVAP